MSKWKTVQIRAELYERIKEEALEERGEKVSTAVNRALMFLIDTGFFKYGRTEKWLEQFLNKNCKGKENEGERVLDTNVEPVKGELKREEIKEVIKPEEKPKPEKREEAQGGTGFVLEW